MTTLSIDNLPGPTGVLLRARFYAPSDAVVTDLALVESSGDYSGSIDVSLTESGTFEYEVRQVSAQTSGAFDASTTEIVSRGDYAELLADGADAPAALPMYGTLAEADEIAAALPAAMVARYVAGDGDARQAWLIQATANVDALRYQGRKYSESQTLQFPRAAYGSAGGWYQGGPSLSIPPRPGDTFAAGDVVWDLDTDGTAIVPPAVKRAVVLEAASIAAARRSERLDAIADGLASQSVDGMSESYRADAAGKPAPVCRLALNLLQPYLLKQGRLL